MNVGFLVFPNLEELDLIGPWEMIGLWGEYFDGPERRLLIAQDSEPVACAKGLRIVPDCSFDDCPPLDLLLVPGGRGTREEVENQALITFVREQAASCQHVLSICTGAFILQAAGLLAGKRATIHWNSLDRLRQFTEVIVVEERVVHDGRIWTAAGVSAGIDLALALIEHLAGTETAGRVQFAAEYYPGDLRYGTAHQGPEAPGYLARPA